jgi:hypothetical protein
MTTRNSSVPEDGLGAPASPSGSRPSDGAASVSTPDGASIPNAITLAREVAIRDAAMLEAAKWAEEGSLLDLCGIASKRKRDRKTAIETRTRLAELIRARVANRFDRPDEMLRDIANGSYGHRLGLSTVELADAFLLAQRGLVVISAEVTLAGSWNSSPPETVWRVRLSDQGKAELAAIAIETRQGGDVQQAPSRSDESAGPQDIAQ